MDNVLDHFSISSLNTYDRCNLQWYYRYALGMKIAPGASLVIGKNFHKAEEENFRQKIASGQDLPTEHVLGTFSDGYDEGIKDARLNKGEKTGELKDQALRSLEKFHKEAASNIFPQRVEERHQVNIGGYSFVAIMDLIDKYNAVRDLKCVGKTPSEDEISYSPQLTAYDLVYRKVYGERPSQLWLDYSVRLKTMAKVVQRSCKPRSEVQLKLFEEEVAMKREAITKGVFLPASPDSWVCTAKWCGYYNICKYGQKRKGRKR